MPTDFLGIKDEEFYSLNSFFGFLESVDLDDLDGKLKIIGSISDFDNQDNFVNSLEDHFQLNEQNGNLVNLSAQVSEDEERIPYYVYVDDTFPVFFTTGTLTKEIPPTLQEYLLTRREMSRMWIAKRQMERLRESLVSEHPYLLIPFFTGQRTKNVNIPANRRPDTKRTIVYYGDDGLETYREMKHQYGVLPSNIEFENPGGFNFRVKEQGIFTLLDSGVSQVYTLLRETKEHLRRVKDAIDTSSFGEASGELLERTVPYSEPWGIQLESGLSESDISDFRENIEREDKDLTITEYSPSYEPVGFSAEVVDTENFARAELKTTKDSIRIYPRDTTGIDQNVRLYNFVDDYIDPHCRPVEI